MTKKQRKHLLKIVVAFVWYKEHYIESNVQRAIPKCLLINPTMILSNWKCSINEWIQARVQHLRGASHTLYKKFNLISRGQFEDYIKPKH